MKQKIKKIVVFSILEYLKLFAKLQLRKNNPTIIGITATAGKSSTMMAVNSVLKNTFQTKISKNANSETGIPLNILGIKISSYTPIDWLKVALISPAKLLTNWEKFQIYIAEMGIDSPHPPKNMTFLLSIIRPKIGVFLNARPLHSNCFDPLVSETNPQKRKEKITTLIASEKGKLIESLPEKGFAIINLDDQNVKKFANKTKAKLITISQNQNADIKAESTKSSLSGTEIVLNHKNQSQRIFIKDAVLPNHYGLTAAAGVAVGLALGMSFKRACRELEKNFELPPGRASLITAKNGALIIDSSYNSSAQPAIDMLELLRSLPKKRKVAILGDLRELGQVARIEHELVASFAAKACDLVCLVGPQTKNYMLPILQNEGVETKWFETAKLAAEFLLPQLDDQTLILAKGSQNTIFLEIAVEKLMANPEKADELLCRRGKFWDNTREPFL